MLKAGPAVQPNSAENALVSTADFLHGAERHRRQHRLAAPAFVVAGAVEHVGRGAAAARTGNEVGRVDEQVAGALALAERRVEERQRGHLAAEDRRLVDRRAVEADADLRVGAHALVRAEDSDFRSSRRRPAASRAAVAVSLERSVMSLRVFVGEALLRHLERVGARQRQRREASRCRRRPTCASRTAPVWLFVTDDLGVLHHQPRLVGHDDHHAGVVRRLRERRQPAPAPSARPAPSAPAPFAPFAPFAPVALSLLRS